MRYSRSLKSAFPVEFNYPELPDDLVEVNEIDSLRILACPPFHDFKINVDGSVEIFEVEVDRMAWAVGAVKAKLQEAIDQRLALINQKLGYDFKTEEGLTRYCGYPNKFRVEAERFGAWTADVWHEANEYKAEVLSGAKPMLSPEDAVAMMPEYPE